MLLSFLFDIPIFLPILGVMLFFFARREGQGTRIAWFLVAHVFFIVFTFCFFWKQYLLMGFLIAALILAILLYAFTKNFIWTFSLYTLVIFWIVSGGLYFDLWGEGGNHFMWYSWLDKIGVVREFPVPTPTYNDFYGPWNLLGLGLFLTYPFFMLKIGKIYFRFFSWLKGILFGHTKGQTGLWGLLTNR